MASSRTGRRAARGPKGSVFEVEVERLLHGPGSVARAPDGRVAFLDRGLPGERVRVRVEEDRRDYVRASVVRLLDPPSPERRSPPCEVVGLCGGCPWQSLQYERQVQAKQEIVLGEVRRICGVSPREILPPIHGEEWGGRHRIRLAVGPATRAGEPPLVGYRPRRGRDVIPIEACEIARAELSAALPLARRLAVLVPRLQEIELSVDDRAMLRFWGRCDAARAPQAEALWEDLCAAAAEQDLHGATFAGLSLVSSRRAGDWRLDLGDVLQRIEVPPGLQIQVPLGSFSQVNLDLNRKLVEAVVTAAGGPQGRVVLDLYCGAGNFSLPLAAAGARVLGVDSDARAIACALSMAEAASLADRARFVAGPAGLQAFPELDEPPYAVVLDPPRAGASAILPELLNLGPARIIYVSCDLATFCRDARVLLGQGWALSSLQLLDLTPQSYRAEIVGLFRLT